MHICRNEAMMNYLYLYCNAHLAFLRFAASAQIMLSISQNVN